MTIAFLLALAVLQATAAIEQNSLIEREILAGYNRKHRPVVQESTVTQVDVFLSIMHIEQVNEKEQTLMLHGILAATWLDEYLKWELDRFNNTQAIMIDTWKIWQPSFALFNTARSNGWYLYMNAFPATVINTGRVYSTGSFSFYVTCTFDFADYPRDVQSCPIVITDWIYDLSQVNLSNSIKNEALSKPVLRLSFDTVDGEAKRHVAGWEVIDTWRRHCYWAYHGCHEERPDGPLDMYWSVLEFGIKIKRHAPYVLLTVVLPVLATTLVTLVAFWIDDFTVALSVLTFNLVLQGIGNWALVRQMPNGNGKLPRIGYYYMINFILCFFAYSLHIWLQLVLNALPPDVEFPFRLTNFTDALRRFRFFKVEGLSFDPQKIVDLSGITEAGPEEPIINLDPPTNQTVVNVDDPFQVVLESLPFESGPVDSTVTSDIIPLTSRDVETEESQTVEAKPEISAVESSPETESHLARELHTLRRVVFTAYVVAYVIMVPWLLL